MNTPPPFEADPCIPSDLAPRLADDFVRNLVQPEDQFDFSQGTAGFKMSAMESLLAHRDVSWPTQCDQLGIPFTALPMCF